MLEEERDKAAQQEQLEAAQRSHEEAEALRQQHEAQRQQYEAQRQQLYQQQQAAAAATGQANRQQSWYTKPIGRYESIKPIDPRGGGQ
jgi:hypothetical protein